MTVEQNVARGKAVTELLELGEALCRDGGWDIASFWTAVSVGAADRAGIVKEADFLKEKEKPKPKRQRTFSSLDDDDEMPWGKHKGERLGDVPDDYWEWFLEQEWCENWPSLVEYAELA